MEDRREPQEQKPSMAAQPQDIMTFALFLPSFLPSFLGHIALLIYVSFERTSAREIPLCPDD